MVRMQVAAAAFVSTAVALAPTAMAESNQATVPFSAGAEGWSINGNAAITATGGNPAHRIFWNNPVDTFGIEARNNTHASFIGNYVEKGPVTLSMDFQVNFIQFFGSPVSRDLMVILYDDNTYNGAPAASVWKVVGTLPGTAMPWTTFSTTVPDVTSAALPTGWHGAGAEDPNTFEPILPAGRTWTNVLQGVDRIQFTTYKPGWFYGSTNFSLSIDNPTITPLVPPCPADLDHNGAVDGADLGTLLGLWGAAGQTVADLDHNGKVDGADLGILLGEWGPCDA